MGRRNVPFLKINMESTGSVSPFRAGAPLGPRRLKTGLLVLAWLWAWPALAQSQEPGGGELRVREAPSGGVEIEWTRQAGPPWLLGWHLERKEPAGGGGVRLTHERVEAGLFDSPATIYRFHDAAVVARAGDVISYRLVVVDLDQQEAPGEWGALTVEAAGESPAEADAKALIPRPVPVRRDAGPPTVGTRIRIEVDRDGFYRLSAAQIAAALEDADETLIRQRIAQTNFSLSCGGESVAWEGEAGGEALQFYGDRKSVV